MLLPAALARPEALVMVVNALGDSAPGSKARKRAALTRGGGPREQRNPPPSPPNVVDLVPRSALEIEMWTDKKGLDIEQHVISEAYLPGPVGWFWQQFSQRGATFEAIYKHKILSDLYFERVGLSSRYETGTFGRTFSPPGDGDRFLPRHSMRLVGQDGAVSENATFLFLQHHWFSVRGAARWIRRYAVVAGFRGRHVEQVFEGGVVAGDSPWRRVRGWHREGAAPRVFH